MASSDGTRPKVGFSVTRHTVQPGTADPVASDPCEIATIPLATAAAGPPLDPPADSDTSHGLRVGANPAAPSSHRSTARARAPPDEREADDSNRAASSVVRVETTPASRNAATPTQCGVPSSSWPASFNSIGTPSPARSNSGSRPR